MTATQAGLLASALFLGCVLACLWPAGDENAWERYRGLLAVTCLGTAILAALVAVVLVISGCPAPRPERPPQRPAQALDPCPGGRPDPTKELGCAFPDSAL